MTDEESMFSACVFPGWLKSVCFSFLILHPVFVFCGRISKDKNRFPSYDI
jgi:hypothetical protein